MTTSRPGPEPTRFRGVYAERLALLEGLTDVEALMTGTAAADQQARFDAWQAPFGPPDLPPVRVDDREVGGAGRDQGVPVRVYQPQVPATGRAALMWMHGGAFVGGDLDMPEADHVARVLAHDADAVVVSVGYRLCLPPVRFPAPHDDCLAVWDWMQRHAAELGIDARRVAVGGASAGAALAAGAALELRDRQRRGEARAPWQVLLAYPVVHQRLPEPSGELAAVLATTPAVLRFPPETTAYLSANYLGERYGRPVPYAFAGDSDDLTGFPPTFIENAELDDLRASGERFAQQLADAGVAVETVTACGVPHGHLNPVGSPFMRASLVRYAERLRGVGVGG